MSGAAKNLPSAQRRGRRPAVPSSASAAPTAAERAAETLHRLGPLVIGAVFLLMLIWSWGKWCDAVIDFGRELYTPWRLTQGDVLYRDIAAFYGPLSPYVNALWFAVLGDSLRTLALCNAAIAALFVWLLYRMLRRAAGPWSALGGCLVFLVMFGFARLLRIGNYNFIAPYSHEIVHGTVLSFALIALVTIYARRESMRAIAAAGCLYGLIFLTKLEPFVAVSLACGAGFLAILRRRPAHSALRLATTFLGAAAAVVLVAWALLATAMPASEALRGVLGSWVYVADPQLRGVPFFKNVMGVEDLGQNLREMIRWLAIHAAMFVPALIAGLLVRRPSAHPAIAVAIACGVGLPLVLVMARGFDWDAVGRPLPLFIIAATIIALVRAPSRGADREAASRHALQLMLLVFAGGMLMKMAFNVRFSHYGFVLAMPATVLFAAMLLEWVPQWIASRGGAGWIFRSVAVGAVIGTLFFFQQVTDRRFEGLTHRIGFDGDQAAVDEIRGEVIASVIDQHAGAEPRAMRRHAQPGDTMVVIPEGVMLNYLLRMPSSVPYLTFLPTDLTMFGEDKMLRALEASPPTFVLFVHRSTREFGARYFGEDYGLAIQRWIDANYERIGVAGDEPLQEGSEFGIVALRRIDPPPQPGPESAGN